MGGANSAMSAKSSSRTAISCHRVEVDRGAAEPHGAKEAQKLLKMEEELRQQVIGQDEAVIAISKALRRSRADLKIHAAQSGHSSFWAQPASERRFWHVLWRSFMFGDADALIQIDMSEYMERFTGSRLIGSPPGYVGYEEGGQLSEAVRQHPTLLCSSMRSKRLIRM